MNCHQEKTSKICDGFDPPAWNINDYPDKTEGWVLHQIEMRKKVIFL